MKYVYIMALLLLMAACTQKEDYFRAENYSENYMISNVPENFDWSMVKSLDVTIIPNDEYSGNYYYTVELYDVHPIYNADAVLYAKGVCTGQEPFSQRVVVPNAVPFLYACIITPGGRKIVSLIETSENNVICDFSKEPSVSESMMTRASISMKELPNYEITVPADAIEINENTASPFYLKAKTNYVVRGTYNGELYCSNGGEQVYIEGTLNNLALGQRVQNGTAFHVLKGGVLTIKQAAIWSFVGKSYLEIATGGIVNAENASFVFTNEGYITNYGKLNLNAINYQSGADFTNYGEANVGSFSMATSKSAFENYGTYNGTYLHFNGNSHVQNDGTLVVDKIYSNSGSYIVNNHYFEVKLLEVNMTTIVNNCYMKVTENSTFGGVTLSSVAGSKFTTNEMNILYGTVFNLEGDAIFEVVDVLNAVPNSLILNGTTKKYALFTAGKMVFTGWVSAKFKGNIEVVCSNYTQNKIYDIRYQSDNSVRWVEESTLDIESCDCNRGGVSTDPENPENPTFPYEQINATTYTWIFEDNYPKYGDYDMNDVVFRIDSILVLKDKQNLVMELKLRMSLVAIGATKHIGIALQLDKLSKNEIAGVNVSGLESENTVFEKDEKGLELGVNLPIIPLTDNVHMCMGYSDYEIVNTYANHKGNIEAEMPFEVSVNFVNPIEPNKVNVDGFNFFIVPGDDYKTMRSEVHIPGFAHTSKSKTNEQIIAATSTLMWSLMVPKSFKYPAEAVNIKSAYPNFELWVTSNKSSNVDWYNYPSDNTDYIYE